MNVAQCAVAGNEAERPGPNSANDGVANRCIAKIARCIVDPGYSGSGATRSLQGCMEFFERGAEVASTMRGQKLNNGAGDFMRFRSMAEHVDDSDEQTVALFDNKANVSGRRLAEERPDSYAVFIGFGPGRQPFSNCCPGSAVRVRYQYEFIHHALYAGQT